MIARDHRRRDSPSQGSCGHGWPRTWNSRHRRAQPDRGRRVSGRRGLVDDGDEERGRAGVAFRVDRGAGHGRPAHVEMITVRRSTRHARRLVDHITRRRRREGDRPTGGIVRRDLMSSAQWAERRGRRVDDFHLEGLRVGGAGRVLDRASDRRPAEREIPPAAGLHVGVGSGTSSASAAEIVHADPSRRWYRPRPRRMPERSAPAGFGGGVPATTVTLKVSVSVAPAESWAVHVIVVVPRWSTVPAAGLHVGVGSARPRRRSPKRSRWRASQWHRPRPRRTPGTVRTRGIRDWVGTRDDPDREGDRRRRPAEGVRVVHPFRGQRSRPLHREGVGTRRRGSAKDDVAQDTAGVRRTGSGQPLSGPQGIDSR